MGISVKEWENKHCVKLNSLHTNTLQRKQNTIKVYQGISLYPTRTHIATNFFYWGKKQDWGLSSASLAK